MCLQCCVSPIEYGEVIPGILLIRATQDYYDEMYAKEWGLVICNDPFFIFKETPRKFKDKVKDKDEYYTSLYNFIDELFLKPADGEYLLKKSRENGFSGVDEDGYPLRFDEWLYNKIADTIENSTPEHTNVDIKFKVHQNVLTWI